MGQTYDPLNVLKPAGPDIWVVDGPLIRLLGLPFPTRMTVVRLASGGLWLHSPIAWNEGLARAVAALGEVQHLIAPNWIHYAGVPAWAERFPGAQVWAAPGVEKRAASQKIAFPPCRPLAGADPWAGEIETLLVEGSSIHHEVVFFHRASASLILTDLIENFEAERLPWYFRWLTWAGGIQHPDGKIPRDMLFSFRKGRGALRRAVEQMIDWAPERVIFSHGKWYEADGTAELRRAFRKLL